MASAAAGLARALDGKRQATVRNRADGAIGLLCAAGGDAEELAQLAQNDRPGLHRHLTALGFTSPPIRRKIEEALLRVRGVAVTHNGSNPTSGRPHVGPTPRWADQVESNDAVSALLANKGEPAPDPRAPATPVGLARTSRTGAGPPSCASYSAAI